jgi:hypothetical protein
MQNHPSGIVWRHALLEQFCISPNSGIATRLFYPEYKAQQ